MISPCELSRGLSSLVSILCHDICIEDIRAEYQTTAMHITLVRIYGLIFLTMSHGHWTGYDRISRLRVQVHNHYTECDFRAGMSTLLTSEFTHSNSSIENEEPTRCYHVLQ
ncbi:MAG: hypothetical protein J07HQW2_01379 [Haloquadratum walsbyi J07HQW2]|uniref:Uncharacterized protein n=1 Tax=Haloquadratum walsbyi J07HQW2 TaxID=1238425 RepID=U1PMI3_9EURY|nr:MAG: hypothetical protein J07HQW2_01379 [Haloquadratum walsbyi J07HQW2]